MNDRKHTIAVDGLHDEDHQLNRRNEIIKRIYIENYVVFCAVAARYWRNHVDVISDLIQNFFASKISLLSLEQLESIDAKGAGYMRRMFRNFIVDQLRKRESQPTSLELDIESLSNIPAPDSTDLYRLVKAIASNIRHEISEIDAYIFENIAVGVERKIIANELGISQGAIDTRLSRLRKNSKFKQIIQSHI